MLLLNFENENCIIQSCEGVQAKPKKNYYYKINFYEGEEAPKAPEVAGALIPNVNSKIWGCAGKNKEKILLNIQTNAFYLNFYFPN